TTLLLVTHDIYSAAKLSTRIAWFDHGTVVADGDPTTVVKAYEDSIRVQEEHRLRVKKHAELAAARADRRVQADVVPVLIEVAAKHKQPLSSPVYFSDVSVRRGEETVARLPLLESSPDDGVESHLIRDVGSWGDAGDWQGRAARPMLNYGS